MKSVATQTDSKQRVKKEEQSTGNDQVENKDATTDDSGVVFHCSFEVFGIVQGVSFRMYTLRRAQKLGVRGWCMNTSENTVKGEIEGYLRPFESMRLWLKHTGSPTSRIDKCIFTEILKQPDFTFSSFSILVE